MSQISVFNVDTNDPIRLIQYLGSKLRVIEYLVPEVKKLIPEKSILLDLFAGTTVVGQSLANSYKIYSNDVMSFSKVFAESLIVGPSDEHELDNLNINILLNEDYKRNFSYMSESYDELLMKEEEILLNKNFEKLGNFYAGLPRIWNEESWNVNNNLRKTLNISQRNQNNILNTSLKFPSCLFTTYYIGSYFGLKQSIIIDSLRYSLESLFGKKERLSALSAIIGLAWTCL